MVKGMSGESTNTSKRGDVEDQTAAVAFLLAHHPDCFHGDTHCAEEQSLELIVHFLFSRGFRVTGERVSGIVDYDIKMIVASEVC